MSTCNPRDNYMHFTGYVLRHGDPPHFLWGKNLQCIIERLLRLCFRGNATVIFLVDIAPLLVCVLLPLSFSFLPQVIYFS